LIREASADDARGDGPRRREPEIGEAREQPPFAERARPIEPGPEVVVLHEPRDRAAAMVMTQHPALVAAVDAAHAAAAGALVEPPRLALDVSVVEKAEDVVLCDRRVVNDECGACVNDPLLGH